MIKREHWDGDLGWPSSVVSNQSRTRAPSLPFQFPPQCLACSEHLLDIVECMNHLLEAFHMWREWKFLEGLGQWIILGKVWWGLLNLIDFFGWSVTQVSSLSSMDPVCLKHELNMSGTMLESGNIHLLLPSLSLELEAQCVPLVMS